MSVAAPSPLVRTTIGIAMGIVMERLDLDADVAFGLPPPRLLSPARKLYVTVNGIAALPRPTGTTVTESC